MPKSELTTPTVAAAGFDALSPLLTDLYQLTMLEAYHAAGMRDTAVFEFFVRKLPAERRFLVAAGLGHTLSYLENLHFSADDLKWLQDSGRFGKSFIDSLSGMRFTGDVEAMPEGTVFFANEPVLRVIAPLPEAQLIEPILINALHFQTLIASKAARFRLTAADKLLVDFGLRRAHGPDAGLLAARAGYIAGFDGTATVMAEPAYGIPLYGTMAHSYIQAFGDEYAAFKHFARVHPDNSVLLIDTYDTAAAAAKVVELAGALKQDNIAIHAVRIDSGDLGREARHVRRILDEGGCQSVRIFVSGGLDEYEIARLISSDTPINGYGVGTQLDCSADRPYLDCAYKLQEYAGQPRRKRSEGKATWPGRKQVLRQYDDSGSFSHDILALVDEDISGQSLLQPVIRNGRRLHQAEAVVSIREHAMKQIKHLPPGLKQLGEGAGYEVRISHAVRELADQLDGTSH